MSPAPTSNASVANTVAPRRRWPWLVTLGCVGLVLIGVSQTRTPEPQPPLNVAAGRGLAGVSLTSREPSPISKCDLTLDDGKTRWEAVITGTIHRSETTQIAWSKFRSHDKPLPAYLGRQGTLVLSCWVNDAGFRRTAGFY